MTNESLLWYKRAAERGNVDAMYNLGRMYSKGIGTKVDMKEALFWFNKAMEHGTGRERGHGKAYYAIGRLFYKGEGVKKDYAQAEKYFLKAAELGEKDAYLQLGYFYHNGDGNRKDTEKAITWYKKAAQTGNDIAMHNLGALMAEKSGYAKVVSVPAENSKHSIDVPVKKPLLRMPKTFAGRSLAASLLILLIGGSWFAGCATTQPNTKIVKNPASPQQSLTEATTATTRISTDVGNVAANVGRGATNLGNSAKTITDTAHAGRTVTPVADQKLLFPYWDKIIAECDRLLAIKADNDKAVVQLQETQKRVQELKDQIEQAKATDAAEAAAYQKALETQQKANDALQKKNEEATKALHDQTTKTTHWIIVVCMAIIGICITLCFVSPTLSKWGIGGAIGAGVVLGLAIFIGETLWMLPWIVGGVLLLLGGYVAYQLFVKNKALTEVVQTATVAKQVLGAVSPEHKNWLFGHGAIHGQADLIQSTSTQKLVNKLRGKKTPIVREATNVDSVVPVVVPVPAFPVTVPTTPTETPSPVTVNVTNQPETTVEEPVVVTTEPLPPSEGLPPSESSNDDGPGGLGVPSGLQS